MQGGGEVAEWPGGSYICVMTSQNCSFKQQGVFASFWAGQRVCACAGMNDVRPEPLSASSHARHLR
jgi:hypothetical protein